MSVRNDAMIGTTRIEDVRGALPSAPQEVKDLLKNLAQQSGLTEEQYWNSSETIRLYRRWILINKLIEQLYDNEEIHQPGDFLEWQDALLASSQHLVTIDFVSLHQIE